METILEQMTSTPEGMKEFLYEQAKLEIAEMVWVIMDKKGISKKDLSDKMGCSKSYVAQILNGDANFTIKKISELLHALGHSLHFEAGPVVSLETKQYIERR